MPISSISGNTANNLNAVGVGRIKNRASTDAVDGNSVNEVRVLTIGTDAAGEKAKSPLVNSGVAKPTDLVANGDNGVLWAQAYQLLWKIKIARIKQNHG